LLPARGDRFDKMLFETDAMLWPPSAFCL